MAEIRPAPGTVFIAPVGTRDWQPIGMYYGPLRIAIERSAAAMREFDTAMKRTTATIEMSFARPTVLRMLAGLRAAEREHQRRQRERVTEMREWSRRRGRKK